MKRKNALLALLMSVTIIASFATGCSTEIDTSVPDVSVTTTTTAATTKATTTAATTTTTAATTTTTVATTTTTAAATTTKPVTKVAATAKPVAVTTAPPVTTKAPVTTTAAPPAQAVNTAGLGKYVYNTLSAEEKNIYDEIVAAVIARKETCNFSSPHSGETVTKVFKDVFYQESSLFWLYGSGASYAGTISSIPLTYKYSAADQAVMQKNLDGAVAAIQARIPAGASTVTKLKVMHDYIILKTAFSKDADNAKDAYGPLVAGIGQCEGYAKATSYACTRLGIENVRIIGSNPKGLSHAWNKVLVNGAWYNIDLTWDDPEGHTADFMVYNFMLVPDSQFNPSRIVECSFTPPAANSLDANYFVQYGLYITDANQAVSKVQSEMIKSAKAKNQVVEIKCSTKAVYDAALSAVLSQAGNMQNTTNATPGCNRIAKLQNGSDANTLVIRLNLVY